MSENPPITVLNLSDIKELSNELTQVSLLLARHQDSGEPVQAEIFRRLPTLRQMLARFEQELAAQSKRSELAALSDVSQAIGSSLGLTEVLNRVMDQIVLLTGAERAILMLVDPDTGAPEFRVARNMDRETIDESSFEISRSIVSQVAATGEAVVTTNAQLDPRFKKTESVVGYSLRSILCIPLRVHGRITGVIYADHRARAGLFSDRDQDLLTTFASQVAVSIENARLFESVTNAKALMGNIFASITSGVITIDVDDWIILFNRAARHIFQASEASVVGARFADVFPMLATSLRPLLEEVKAQGRPVAEFETDLLLPNRGTVDLRISLSPLKDGNDELQGVAIVLDDLTEQRRLESRYQLFQRYLSPAVIERLPADPQELKLGGQRQEITSLFADVRGFSDFSQRHDPETLMEILNRYLSAAAQAVLAEQGTLDKFMGDGILAFFNAPLPQDDHVLRALRTALLIDAGVAHIHKQMPPDRRLDYGIGISVGDAVVGNVGTRQRLDYTAIGASVNLARRLQEAAEPGQILICDTAYERTRESIMARPLPYLRVEGISAPGTAFELLGLHD